MASYAALGDLILAEPAAMIGFAGPRVIKDTTHAELPPGFQTAEFLLDHGLIDAISRPGDEGAICEISRLFRERKKERLKKGQAFTGVRRTTGMPPRGCARSGGG